MSPFKTLVLAAMAGLGLAASAQAQLLALTHDLDDSRLRVAELDPLTASLNPIGIGAVSTELAYGANALDPFTRQIFTLGPDPVTGDGTLALYALDADTGDAVRVGNTGSPEQAVALEFDVSTQRLIAALATPLLNELRLVEIDITDASLSELHSGPTDCCVLDAGVATLRDGELLLSGRFSTDAPGTRRLIALSTSGDNQTGNVLLASPLAALAYDSLSSTLFAVIQNPSMPAEAQLVAVEPGGTLVTIGAAQGDCCVLAPGLGVLVATDLRWYLVGRTLTETDLGVLAFNLNTGAVTSSSGSFPATQNINGILGPLTGLTPLGLQLTSTNTRPPTGGTVILTASLGDGSVNSGTVSFLVDGSLLPGCDSVAVVAGQATCQASFDTDGLVQITVNFSGNSIYLPASVHLSMHIGAHAIPTLSSLALVLLSMLLGLAALPRLRKNRLAPR